MDKFENQKKTSPVTIKDIAAMAGVSVGTVSRVINDKEYVAPATKKRILKCIKETGYNPSVAARSLNKSPTNLIGVVVPEISNPFLSELFVSIEHILSKKGYALLLCNTEHHKSKFKQFINDLAQWNAYGFLIISVEPDAQDIAKLQEQGMNAVTIFVKTNVFDYVCVTESQGMFDITEHLISKGHDRIAYVGLSSELSTMGERFDGYKTAMEKHGLALNKKHMAIHEGRADEGFDSTQKSYEATRTMLGAADPPTAFIYANDHYAINGYMAIAESGLQVGKDIAVAGFDNIPISKLLMPPLSTVAYDTITMAELASDMVIRKKSGAGGSATNPKRVLLPTTLIVRQSTES